MKGLNIVIVFLVTLPGLFAEEAVGCQGYIKSRTTIDFSKVKILLYTKQGSLKDDLNVTSPNGYYFIRLYDKGEYLLKISPPPGWSFEPEFVEINFDGKTDVCSKQKDVNFTFKGFGITGIVNLINHLSGIKGVTVNLESENGSDTRQTITNTDGIFSFTPIIPGKYLITASHEKWHFSKSRLTVLVKTGNTELPQNSLIVSGFDVIGKIKTNSQSQTIIKILLYKEKTQLLKSNCELRDLDNIEIELFDINYVPICLSNIEKGNEFSFKGVAPGKYIIKPIVNDKKIKLNLVPDIIHFTVDKDSIELKELFEVTGFRVSGNILVNENGQGLSNVTVILNNLVNTKTAIDGSYMFENIKSGTHTINAKSENFKFPKYSAKLSASNPIIPDIYASEFKVCGQILSKYSYPLLIKEADGKFLQKISSDTNTGNWCTYLPIGKYIIEVEVSNIEKSKGIQFFPIQQTIDVSTSPIFDIKFSQLQAKVKGEIKCLSSNDNNCYNSEITLQSVVNSNTISTKIQDGKYVFNHVLPGEYEITILESNLCWEETTKRINVKSEQETVSPFIHKGYEISVISSHRGIMEITFQTSNKIVSKFPSDFIKTNLLPGINTICVPKPGTYTIQLIGCHKYDDNMPTNFSTQDNKPLVITAISHKNGIRILSTEDENFKMLVEKEQNKETVNLIKDPFKIDGYNSYFYEIYLKPEEEIFVKPLSNIMLFNPESENIIGGNNCSDIALSFMATRGLIINGKINPPIKNVKIIMSFPKNSNLTTIETFSSDIGTFTFGPINRSLYYEINAYKESYVFSEFEKTTFTINAHRLSEISVIVKDTLEKSLDGVLLSLSGGESYRKNLITNKDGKITFSSLSPGQYFLRPMMKEYEFDPDSKILNVRDGETIEMTLTGKRVSYSIFGTIASLNREPFSNVILEAISDEKCKYHQEESANEINGHYRIRGLKPHCRYNVRIKQIENNQNVERCIPELSYVDVKNEDVLNINFIAISPLNFVDVTASVYASSIEFYKNLRIQMYRKGSAESPIYSQRVDTPLVSKGRINPGIMVFFPRIPLDRKTYYIELKTTISDKTYKFILPTFKFVANTSTIFAELSFEPQIRGIDCDINQSSISALLLVVIIVIAFFEQNLAFGFLKIIWNRLSSTFEELLNEKRKKKDFKFNEPINYKEIDQLVEGINATKKKRSKKI